MHTAVVAGGQVYYRQDLGTGDNNDAEWLALFHALDLSRSLGIADALLLGDSALVVAQASGASAPTARFIARREQVRVLLEAGAGLRIRRVRRSQNLAGIALERLHGRL